MSEKNVTDRGHYMEVIDKLERCLRGEVVDGLRIGDTGITREWAETALVAYRGFLDNLYGEDNVRIPEGRYEKYSQYDTRLRETL